MTVSEGLVVFCNGDRGRCKERFETSSPHASEAVEQARSRGWQAPDVNTLHYCPRHRTAEHDDVGLDIFEPGGPARDLPELDVSTLGIDLGVAAAYEQLRALAIGRARWWVRENVSPGGALCTCHGSAVACAGSPEDHARWLALAPAELTAL